ncbi:MAG: efflux transporter, family, subunit, partial [Gemmatimonadetes bacterium]|nr:efflux transporter, family, subunit [Gemmatimonadota bacterium]
MASHGTHAGAAPPVEPMGSRRMLMIAIGTAVVLLLLLVLTLVPRHRVDGELRAEAAGRDSAPVVLVTTVRRATGGGDLSLPGTIQPLHEGAIYARVGGYVRSWSADIGSTVRAGQVLAVIDAPELEQNVQQAQAQLAQTRAALNLARADLERWRGLARDGAVTGQEMDQKSAAYEAAAANTAAAEANVRRLQQTRQYTRVTAPFTGIVTARGVDIGSLITAAGASSAPVAGAPAGAAGSMFRIASTDTVRTFVTVPETYAASIRPGLQADVVIQGLANRRFSGFVARTSGALDPGSRTLLTEIDIANRDLALLPGMYAQVQLHFPRVSPPLTIPATSLVIRSSGPQVMMVERGRDPQTGTVHFRTVQIGRDYGATVELAGGIIDGATIVLNPNANLIEGSKVRIGATS